MSGVPKPPEMWAELEGFSNYIVSNHGRVVNVNRDRVVEGTVSSRGGMRRVVLVSDNGEVHSVSVGTLVARHFLSGYVEGNKVMPRDGDPSNCAVWNLRFAKGRRTGVIKTSVRGPIERRHLRVVETGEVFRTAYDAARHIGADPSAVYKVLRGDRPNVRGFTFEYFWA